MTRFRTAVALLLALGTLLGAQDGDVVEPLWRRALGGRIDAYPAQGPQGDVYVVADDRALHSVDPQTGESHWIYRPGGRLMNVLLVAPDGTVFIQNDRQELIAVTPGGTGRWKLRMNADAAALPAVAPDGRIIVPLAGGRIVCVSRHGRILWTVDESAEASAGPLVDSDGTAWVPLSDGRVVPIDTAGASGNALSVPGVVSMAALDGQGRIWAGDYSGGVRVFDSRGTRLFEARPGSARVASILTGPDGGGDVFLVDGTRVAFDPDGGEIRRQRIAVGGGAPSAASDGTLYLPAADGSIRVVPPDGDGITELRGAAVLAEPLLSQEGILIAGGGDWILYAWKAVAPGPGWRQFRGGPRRGGSFPADPIRIGRQEARRDPGFFFREQMALSDDLSVRLALLEELESYPDAWTRRRALPWVDLLVEDLAAVGTIRRVKADREPVLSHPVSRGRAYGLLGSDDDFRSRGLLLECLRHEEDPSALAAGFRALGKTGTDWDGASMRLIAERFRSVDQPGDRLVLAAAEALADLVRYNGGLSDPSGAALMDELLRSDASPRIRSEVIGIIRGTMGF